MQSFKMISGIVASTLLLTACGSDDDSSSPSSNNGGHGHEGHQHSLMISQTNTDALSFLEEGNAEALDESAAANGAQLLLSNSGEQAAIITSGTVQFIAAHHEDEHDDEEAGEEEHELPELSALSISGTNIKVANTHGHFSVLANGSTQLVPYEALEEADPSPEALGLGINETYPALMLDEEHELVLAFNGTDAVVYEGTTLEETLFACETVVSTVHTGEFALVSCENTGGSKNYSIKLEENNNEHEAVETDLAIDASVEWQSRADVFVGLGGQTFYVLEENDQEALEQESSFAVPASMCGWGLDSNAADIFVLTAGQLAVHNHEGNEEAAVALDESPNATCADLTMAPAGNVAFVLDNSAGKFYGIDKHGDGGIYHIHDREDLSVNDVASAVSFHEVGDQAGHDH